jgi:hypothetical protein
MTDYTKLEPDQKPQVGDTYLTHDLGIDEVVEVVSTLAYSYKVRVLTDSDVWYFTSTQQGWKHSGPKADCELCLNSTTFKRSQDTQEIL